MPTERETGTPTPAVRQVVFTTQFKKDFRREEKGRHRRTLRADLQRAVDLLAEDIPLPPHMVDHPLIGNWKGHRDCHIKPDLVLIYRKTDPPKVGTPKSRATRNCIWSGSARTANSASDRG